MANEGELGYLLAQRGRPAATGGQALGFMLGGGGAAQRAQIYNQAAYRGAQMQDVLAQARQRQQEGIARDNYAAELRKRGDPDSMDLASMVLSSGANMNPSEIAKAREQMLHARVMQEAINYAKDPNFDQNRQTRLLEAIEGKPQQHMKIEGDTQFDPFVTPGGQTPTTTAVGKARIAELGSLVAEHGAQARRAEAGIGADKAGNYELKDTPQGMVRVNKITGEATPVTQDGNQIAKPPKTPPRFTDTERLSLMGGKPDPETGKVTPDPVKLGDFMSRQAASPGKSDAEIFNDMKTAEMQANTQAANTPSAEMQANLGNMVGGAKQPAKVGDSPHPEGTQLRGPDGKLYVVKNGQPVPLQ